MADMERFRAASGDLIARGRLEYAGRREAVELSRRFGEPPVLTIAGAEQVVDWRQEGLDVALRIVGAVLGADELSEALTALGRPLTEQITTLAFLGDDVVWVIGGAVGVPTARLWVERETYRLRRVEVPMAGGTYVVSLDDYSLAEGWFPSRVVIRHGEREVFRLELAEASRI